MNDPSSQTNKKKPNKLLSAPIQSVLNLSLAPFIYYRKFKAEETKRALQICTESGIEAIECVNLGGIEQWILMRGQDVTNPVLLFLHGGPGLPLMPFHTINADLEEHFTVVHWDQRGAGKSYSPDIPPESMTIDQLVSDTRELVQYLCKRFKTQKIHLIGYSCGSVIGMKTVSLYPELFETYIGIGQIVRMAESEAISYSYALDHAFKSQNLIAIRELELIGPPPYSSHRSMLEERMWINNFGGFFHHGQDNIKFYKTGLLSPDYSLTDIRKLFKGMDFTSRMLWQAFYQSDLFPEIPKVEVPVYFIGGKHDYVVPQTVTEQYVDQLEAPAGKEMIWFEDSAHWPFLEEPQRFHDILLDRLIHRRQSSAGSDRQSSASEK